MESPIIMAVWSMGRGLWRRAVEREEPIKRALSVLWK
jgi:hypothetical protein